MWLTCVVCIVYYSVFVMCVSSFYVWYDFGVSVEFVLYL